MRYFLLASIVVVFASTATDLKAQYPQPQYYLARPPVYQYVAPARPVYVQGYYAAPRHVRQPNPTGFQNRP